ncbi:MAG: hypothetical protein IIB58_03810, partial [Planctomycetes bacterium]|nr:hypothetical protein [Planctomycetota bacterium]
VAVFVMSLVAFSAEKKAEPAKTDSSYIKKEVKRGTERLDKRLRTLYTSAGLPINRGFEAKGYHRVTGSVTLVAGVDTVTLNTIVGGGKHDISFTDSTSYWGRAWGSALADRANSYSILPLSGTKFVVVSSDATDVAKVQFSVEGD